MLKPSDCKPGVEVIAIKNYPLFKYQLSIGMIYTIRLFTERCNIHGKIVDRAVISVNESNEKYAYYLDQFKLRDPNEFTELFKIDDIDPDLLKEDDFDRIEGVR